MTPAQSIIRLKNKEITRAWNRARFRRLAQMLKITEGELGDMAYIPNKSLNVHLRDNSFPPAVAGHLENIERYLLSKRIGLLFEDTGQDYVLREKAAK